MEKTNAMRLLEKEHIPFEVISYTVDESDLSAISVATKINLDVDQVFKTLVLKGTSGMIFVCVIPGGCELDLKKAALATREKNVQLVPVKEILPLSGYIRGGCSPIGMKKIYPTYIDEICQLHEKISISAGMRGLQLLISPADLVKAIDGRIADLV